MTSNKTRASKTSTRKRHRGHRHRVKLLTGQAASALRAADKLRHRMAAIGIDDQNDVISIITAMMIADAEVKGLDMTKVFCDLAPAMLGLVVPSARALAAAGAPEPHHFVETSRDLDNFEMSLAINNAVNDACRELRERNFILAGMWIVVSLVVLQRGPDGALLWFGGILGVIGAQHEHAPTT